MKGYPQVYTGNGKGKTTAALGLALRAAGAGFNVFFAQFMKGIKSGEVIVLDEANVAIRYNLFSVAVFLDLIRIKPDDVELIITGRDADPAVIEAADLVTEMKEVKHYFQQGIPARTGIEK
jgi:cob(I)alamin adenosyltransferase